MNRLILPEEFLRREHRRLWSEAAPWREVPLGLRDAGPVREWYAPARAPGAGTLRLRLFPEVLRGASADLLHLLAPAAADLRQPRVELALFRGRGFAGSVHEPGAAAPENVDELWLQGPRLEAWTAKTRAASQSEATAPASGRFSRYAGALGGALAHARLSELSLAIIGVSRLGSLLATAAAKAGLRALVLIDPDRVEEHHLEAFEACGDVRAGESKVAAAARFLAAIAPQCRVTAIAAPIEDPAALAAALSARVLATAPDRGRPRLVAALAAAACNRVLLDLGTGLPLEPDPVYAGLDVRLILPGQGCLWCVGGLDLAARDSTDWRRERAGSLRSLNGCAVSLAWLLIERLVAGALEQTTWLRLTFDAAGLPRAEAPAFRARADCPLCRESARGAAAWADVALDRR